MWNCRKGLRKLGFTHVTIKEVEKCVNCDNTKEQQGVREKSIG